MTSTLDVDIRKMWEEHRNAHGAKKIRIKSEIDSILSRQQNLNFQNYKADSELREKLTVNRGWFSRKIDWIRNVTYDDIRGAWKPLAWVTGGITFLGFLIAMNPVKDRVLEMADNIKPESSIEFSIQSSYDDYIQKASASTGVDVTILESLMYAAQNNPDYVASARASGRRGIIPLDPVAVGVKGELLDAYPELCISVAAEHYASLREKSDSDLEAIAGVIAGWDECREAISTSVSRYLKKSSDRSDKNIHEEALETHEFTINLIENHKKGELTGFDYYIALKQKEGRTPHHYWEGDESKYKRMFEDAISQTSKDSDSIYAICPIRHPGLRTLTPKGIKKTRDIVNAYQDFTSNLQEALKNSVASARAYLNSSK